MKATPLLFKAEMVQALLREIDKPGSGKTMTRRVMRPQPKYIEHPGCAGWYWESPRKINGFNPVESWSDGHSKEWLSEFIGNRCSPYGKPGDLIWCRETFGYKVRNVGGTPHEQVVYRADSPNISYCQSATGEDILMKWKPSIFMPRAKSRITLLIENVSHDRLQNITESDAKAEGAWQVGVETGQVTASSNPIEIGSYTLGFHDLWISINGQESWDSNPWLWVIKFRPILANVDAVIANPEKYGITNANR